MAITSAFLEQWLKHKCIFPTFQKETFFVVEIIKFYSARPLRWSESWYDVSVCVFVCVRDCPTPYTLS